MRPNEVSADLKTDQFDYEYPDNLVATEPCADFRIALSRGLEQPREISRADLFSLFQTGDVLAINDTRVERRRLLTKSGLEILFCDQISRNIWRVLCAARELRVGEKIELPGGVIATLTAKGLPQTVEVSQTLTTQYFEEFGDLALPPYIQKARGERQSRAEDAKWYQTAWATHAGSQAAPTASLHFTKNDLRELELRGVIIAPLTLHVGIGTFLPVKSEFLHEHKMHDEQVMVSNDTIEKITAAKRDRRKVWALGTTVVRSLESWAAGRLTETQQGVQGSTDLFIAPGFRFEVVDALMTNFHQPRTTLLALVAAFAGADQLRRTYEFAVEQKFRLFSYGDLSVWMHD